MFTVCGHIVPHFDMVAELVRTKVHKIRRIIRTPTKTTITSSSGETKKFKWDYHLKEGADVNMFAHDHRVPRVPQPTSFDGIRPSFLEWSEEVIAYLAFTDYQEFIPLLSAAAASKDVIEKDVMFKGILSENLETIDKVTANQVKKEQDRAKAQTEDKAQEIQDLTQKRSRRYKENFRTSKQNWSRRNQLCSRLSQVYLASCDIRRPNVMVRRITRTSDSDSGAVTGLEIWRQMSIHFAGSAKTRTVSLLKQIMSPVEWNAEKSI